MKNSIALKATICIPTTRSSRAIYQCLDSLEEQSDKSFRVILVTKEEAPKLISQAKKYSFPLSIIKQKREGLVGAMNDGLDQVNSDLFIRIDDDVTLSKRWFKNITKPFEDKKVAAVTGPTLIDDDLLSQRDVFSFLKKIEKNPVLKRLVIDYLYEGNVYEVGSFLRSGVFTLGSNFTNHIPKKSKVVNNVEACNFAVRTALLKEIGGFDDVFSKGLGEYHEADVAFKIQEAGYQIVFHPQAVAHHNIKRGKDDTRPDAYYRIQNFIRFYKRHFKIDSLDVFMRFSTNLLVQNCYYMYTGLKRGDLSQLGAISATIKGLLTTKIS